MSELLGWYRRIGTGTPRLLLHGFTGASLSFEGLVDHLALIEPVAALPLPGHHAKAPVADSFEGNVDWICEQLDAAGLKTVRVLGYSLGARLALGMVARYPERVESACLVSVHTGLDSDEERAARRETDGKWAALLREHGIEAFVARWERQPLFETQAALSQKQRDDVRQVRLSHDPMRLARSLERMGLAEMPNYREDLVASQVPIHLVVGERDQKFVTIARSIHAAQPSIHVTLIAGAGHNVVLEQPGALAPLL